MENSSVIARGVADLVYKRIEKQLNDYMGRIFEEICAHHGIFAAGEDFDLTFGLMYTAGNHGFPAVFLYTEM